MRLYRINIFVMKRLYQNSNFYLVVANSDQRFYAVGAGAKPEHIYNSHYDNGVPANLVQLSIAENPIAVMGL